MMNKRTRIRIVKSEGNLDWYRSRIGEEFDVYKLPSSYVLATDYEKGGHYLWHHINLDDAQEVKTDGV